MTQESSSSDRSDNSLRPGTVLGLTERAQAMPANDPRRSAASISMFDRLAEHWSLRADERETLLGGVSKSTWSEWRGHRTTARIKSDTRERIANLFLIDLNAHSLFASEFADRWVREPNAAFQGESPMSRMLRGKVEDVIGVRRYLERIRTSSPTDASNGEDVVPVESPALSLLPGHAVEVNDNDAALASLRHAVAVYEHRAIEEPLRYEHVFARVLHAYATCLIEADDPESIVVLERLIEIYRRFAIAHPHYEDEVKRSSVWLAGEVMKHRGSESSRPVRDAAAVTPRSGGTPPDPVIRMIDDSAKHAPQREEVAKPLKPKPGTRR